MSRVIEQRTSVVYFLAHDGVKQPDVWKRWLDGCTTERRRVVARVFCNESRMGPFEKDHWVGFHETTAWGTPSLVHVLQRGYQAILDEFPGVDMIYLVSGYDIPVMSPELFATLPTNKSFVPLNAKIATFLDAENVESVNARVHPSSYSLPQISRLRPGMQPSFQSVQWIHLTGEHAAIVAQTPLAPFVQWVQWLNRDGATYVYDEAVPPAMLELSLGIKFGTPQWREAFVDEPLTAFIRREEGDPSPIEWRSFDERILTEEVVDNVRQEYSLERAIREFRDDEFVFFRKVTGSVAFEAPPWLL